MKRPRRMKTASGVVIGQIVRVLDPCEDCSISCFDTDPESVDYEEPCGQEKLKGKLLRVIGLEAPRDGLETWYLTVETLDGVYCTDYLCEWDCRAATPIEQLAECAE